MSAIGQRPRAGVLAIDPDERAAVLWAAAFFFFLLFGYYLLRPLRDAMGIEAGVDKLQWLFTATFLVMLLAVPAYGWAVARFPRRRLIPVVYGFFLVNLLLFYVAFSAGFSTWTARVFFVWVSVFNLFVVSVFWSFMADLLGPTRAERLFPVIAAGGTAGAIAGPTLAATVSLALTPVQLLPLSALCLAATLVCMRRLEAWAGRRGSGRGDGEAHASGPATGGSVIAGVTQLIRSPYLLGICASMLLFTTLATFLYFQQAHVVRDAFDTTAERTAVFAVVDLTVNALTLLGQLFVTGRLVVRFGLAPVLAALPIALAAGFTLLALAPAVGVVLAVQVVRRAGNYALMRPAREMLYTVVSREQRFKTKGFIDTAVYRGGDAVSAWAYAGLTAIGLGIGGIAWVSVPLTLAWAALAFALGRERDRRKLAARRP